MHGVVEFTEREKDSIYDHFQAYISKLGLRQTKQRRVVLDAIFALGPHVDAEAIAQKARSLDPTLGLATVYRTLQLMTAAGILSEKHFGKDRSKFELVSPTKEHHDHLICRRCGEIIEFYDPEIEKLQEKIAKRLGFTLVDHHMELIGECSPERPCTAAKNSP